VTAARPERAVPLLSDATVPVNFCKAGAGRQMAQFLGENAGELATIIWADAEAQEGRRYHILTDDRLGKDLARDRGYAYSNTPELILQMVCAGALSYAHGEGYGGRPLPTCLG
jgi:hypothetical protein